MNMLANICMFILVPLLIIGIVIFLIWYFGDYRGAKRGCVSKITFERFLVLYSINPNNWGLYYDYISYYTNDGHSGCFYFSVIDTFRYYNWRKNKDKIEENTNNRKQMERIIESWNTDIRNYCKENNVPYLNGKE